MEVFDIAVIGGGPAGMAAAGMAAEEGLRVLLIERDEALGGILNQCAHKGFGITYFGEELTGQEYAARCIEAFKKTNAETLTDTMVLGIDENRVITLSGTKTRYDQIRAKAIIIATGCRERPIGALPIVGSRPAGVLSAGAAQKMVNVGGYDIGNNFVILGSGDIGMIVARELALRNKKVIAVIEKEKQCGGLPRNRINCLERFNIPLITETTIKEVHGKARICGHHPFTVQLLYETENGTQPVEMTEDTGYEHVGISIRTRHDKGSSLYKRRLQMRHMRQKRNRG